MKKIVILYGLIAGLVVGAMMMITMPLYENGTLKLDNGELLGYTTMVVALSLVFFGVKSYRDNYQAGIISFGQAAKVGLLITLVASFMYAISWEITYHTMKSDFMLMWSQHQEANMKASGATPAELAEAKASMEGLVMMYRNPFIRFGFTVMEIAPVGIIISLLSAGLLRRKSFLPATSK